MTKLIKIAVKVDEKNNVIAIAEDLEGINIPEGIDRTLYVLGIYAHLFNHQLKKLNKTDGFIVPR